MDTVKETKPPQALQPSFPPRGLNTTFKVREQGCRCVHYPSDVQEKNDNEKKRHLRKWKPVVVFIIKK